MIPLGLGFTLWVIVDIFLFMAATSDPGFIPKQPDDEHTSKWWRQFKNYVVVDGMNGQKTHLIHLKLSYVCMIMRPKRSTHCR